MTDSSPEPSQSQQTPYYKYPGKTQPPTERGGGCWLIGFLTLLIASALVVAGLFLPPFNLGERLFEDDEFAIFDPAAASPGSLLAVEDDGLTILVDPADVGDEFGVALTNQSPSTLATGSGGPDWLQAARENLPDYLIPQSRIYSIDTTGTAPQSLTLTVAVPPDAADLDVIDMYQWDASTGEWVFTPSQRTADAQFIRADVDGVPAHIGLFQAAPINPEDGPTVTTILNIGDGLSTEITDIVDIVSPTGRQPALIPATETNPTRTTLFGSLAPGFETGRGYAIMPVVRNFNDPRATDVDTVVTIISDSALRSQHVQQLADFASAGGYDGIFIDYRDLPEDQRENFSRFIDLLSTRLDAFGIRVGVVVPAAEGVIITDENTQPLDSNWRTGAYDWRALGQHADYVKINFNLNPTTFTPGEGQLVEEMLRWSVGQVSRYKLIGGLSALSVQERDGTFTPVGFAEGLAPIGDVSLETQADNSSSVAPGSEIRIGLDGFDALPGVDETIQTPYIIYNNPQGEEISRIWLTTPEALRFRVDQIISFGLGGVGFNDLLDDGINDDVIASIDEYDPSAAQPQLVLNWRIEDADGEITEFTTRLNEEIVVTLEAADGNYAVNVDVVSGEDTVGRRGGAQIALAAPTQTLAPMPSNTPSPTPTPTPTLVAIEPTVPPTPGQQDQSDSSDSNIGGAPTPVPLNSAPVAPLGPGNIGAFELGGHVVSPASERTQNAMRSAGMVWMKMQIRFSRGASIGAAENAINAARAGGFKVLLGVVGSPNDFNGTEDDYIRQYSEFVARIASLGPDAIEVWNEPNLAREWPAGAISGENYTRLLRRAYQAIKSTNPSVLVISAAPAPTGAEAFLPGLVVNDDNFLRQMVNAGALNFADCVGMHYNEGIVGPYQTSGDPRGDNYYTRYLPRLLDTYWNIISSQRQICITELGYLSSEGYGSLPAGFTWAGGNSVAEQAAWLAEAATYLEQSQRVRMMIVWNVDFTNYDEDPMAGYAIIRRDGGCPACRALSGAR